MTTTEQHHTLAAGVTYLGKPIVEMSRVELEGAFVELGRQMQAAKKSPVVSLREVFDMAQSHPFNRR